MKANRSLMALIFFTIITFGIYALFFWSGYARDMNIVCQGDRKHTRGIFARIVFSLLTFGIYDLVWMYGVGERISANAHRRNIHTNVTGSSVLLWHIFGALVIVGPFIAAHKMIDGLNELCYAYNAARE